MVEGPKICAIFNFGQACAKSITRIDEKLKYIAFCANNNIIYACLSTSLDEV